MFDWNESQGEGASILQVGTPDSPFTNAEVVEFLKDDTRFGFKFKGTDEGNKGTYELTWLYDWYKPENITEDWHHKRIADQNNRIKHVVSSFLNDAELEAMGKEAQKLGKMSIEQTVDFILKHLKDKFKGVPCRLKLVLNSKDYPTLPKFPNFISTTIRQRTLTIGTRTDEQGLPYDRLLPLSHYGIVPNDSNQAEAKGSNENGQVQQKIKSEDLPF